MVAMDPALPSETRLLIEDTMNMVAEITKKIKDLTPSQRRQALAVWEALRGQYTIGLITTADVLERLEREVNTIRTTDQEAHHHG